MGVLVSLVSRIVSLGLPRASGHLFIVGQLLTEASHDPALAVILGRACVGKNDALQGEGDAGRFSCDPAGTGGTRHLRGFSSFLAAHCTSASCPDHVKSDLMYVAMELLDCCTAAASAGLEELSEQVCISGFWGFYKFLFQSPRNSSLLMVGTIYEDIYYSSYIL